MTPGGSVLFFWTKFSSQKADFAAVLFVNLVGGCTIASNPTKDSTSSSFLHSNFKNSVGEGTSNSVAAGIGMHCSPILFKNGSPQLTKIIKRKSNSRNQTILLDFRVCLVIVFFWLLGNSCYLSVTTFGLSKLPRLRNLFVDLNPLCLMGL